MMRTMIEKEDYIIKHELREKERQRQRQSKNMDKVLGKIEIGIILMF